MSYTPTSQSIWAKRQAEPVIAVTSPRFGKLKFRTDDEEEAVRRYRQTFAEQHAREFFRQFRREFQSKHGRQPTLADLEGVEIPVLECTATILKQREVPDADADDTGREVRGMDEASGPEDRSAESQTGSPANDG